MKFASYITDETETLAAIDTLVGQAALDADGQPDVVFFFYSSHHNDAAQRMAARLHEQLEPQVLLGASAEGVIGLDQEIERSPGIALLVGRLPDVRLHSFHVEPEAWLALLGDADGLREKLGVGPETRGLIGFGDPYTTPLNELLTCLNDSFPGLPLVGGMASGAREAADQVLVLDGEVHDAGFVGLSLAGPVEVQTVVSQGCRPIGQPMVITRAEENLIDQLGGRPALEVLKDTLEAMPESEQRLLRGGLFVGRAMSEYRDRFGRGDFLVRNVIGLERERGAIAVAERVRVGQTVQFHVRDAQTADEDLRHLLEAQAGAVPAAGGLLFSCNGRGTRMFRRPCHDISCARQLMPKTPLAGFFAAGELGPVGGRNFVHGHTASFALFRPKV